MRLILCAGLLTLCGPGYAGEPFDMTWHTVDGGGTTFAEGGDYSLGCTVGQADASVMAGGDWSLSAGFWFEQPPGDCNATGIADLLDHADYADCISGPGGGFGTGCECFDFDSDGDNDLADLAMFQNAFGGA